ncbi:MAG: GTP-binding protein [Actinobacteria bacterium]|nr:GTP-binding protein [Actinomycetota bacterium]
MTADGVSPTGPSTSGPSSAGRSPSDEVDVLAVVGVEPVRRARIAAQVAHAAGRALFPAARLGMALDPLDEARALVPWAAEQGAVVELPTSVDVTALIAAFSDGLLTSIVCVVDARRLRADLFGDQYLRRPAPGGGVEHVAAAAVLVSQIEYASAVALEHWQSLPPVDLAQVLDLVGHLAPTAQVHLWSGRPPAELGGRDRRPYGAAQERPGWGAILNGDPLPTVPGGGVDHLRFEQVRPFHPGRLATRPGTPLRWEHVGSMFSLLAAGDDGDDAAAIGQDLAFIGYDLEAAALDAALDRATLDDAELIAGSSTWSGWDEPAELSVEVPGLGRR